MVPSIWGLLLALLPLGAATALGERVVYAVNCGGDEHVDSLGVKYDRDPLHGRVGTASDYGKRLLIGRVPPDDHVLYQTERYHTGTFGYDIPITADGPYVLVLKFCEVYFNAPDQKVFDVVLNGEHTVIADLDIYEKVGRGVAHDEHVPFRKVKDRLYVNGEDSEVRGGRVRVEFIKGHRDNPKVNAMYVLRGEPDEAPPLPPPAPEEEPRAPFDAPAEPQQQQQREEPPETESSRSRRPSGPKHPDPYAEDESSMMLPIFIAIGAFIPLLFCLCKL